MNKKIIIVSILFLLVIATLGLSTYAYEENETFSLEDIYYVNPVYPDLTVEDLKAQINEQKQNEKPMLRAIPTYAESVEEAGATLREGMKNRQSSITVTFKSETQLQNGDQALFDIFNEAISHTGDPKEGDYLGFQYNGWNMSGGTGRYVEGGIIYTLPYTVSYHTTAEQENEMDEAVETYLTTNQDFLNAQNDYEKVKAIHDYMCDNITYDNDHLSDLNYKLQFTGYAALINKTAVCQGYAVLFYRLALENGIDSRIIRGDTNGDGKSDHAWNIVKVGDYYYNIDTTWDSSGWGYKYFLKCENTFNSQNNHNREASYTTQEFTNTYPVNENDFNIDDYYYTGLKYSENDLCYYLYENGRINTEYTGIYDENNEKYYFIYGKQNFKTGFVDLKGKKYKLLNGIVDKSATGIYNTSAGVRYFEEGICDYSYKGICENEGNKYYIEGNKINTKTGFVDLKGKKYKLLNGIVDKSATGIYNTSAGVRYFEEGICDYSYKGICENEGNKYYIEGNKINTKTGIISLNQDKYLVVEGIIKISQNEIPNYYAFDLEDFHKEHGYNEDGIGNEAIYGVGQFISQMINDETIEIRGETIKLEEKFTFEKYNGIIRFYRREELIGEFIFENEKAFTFLALITAPNTIGDSETEKIAFGKEYIDANYDISYPYMLEKNEDLYDKEIFSINTREFGTKKINENIDDYYYFLPDGASLKEPLLIVKSGEIHYYTISFNTNGGNYIPPQTIPYGEKIYQPTDPIREGYTFEGWFENDSFQKDFFFPEIITGDTEIIAKWSKNYNY